MSVDPTRFDFAITPQPDESTCGPACLHSLYGFYNHRVPLEEVLDTVERLPDGGTLTVLLALHAIGRGFRCTTYTCDLNVFDPTWFAGDRAFLRSRLEARMRAKRNRKLRLASRAYLEYLDRGGELLMEDITDELLARLVSPRTPLIVGLSATWLYRCARERPADGQPDDVAGEATGHFVVVHGIDLVKRTAAIADPYRNDPHPGKHNYEVNVDRLICAILLGVVTYDAKLLVLEPGDGSSRGGLAGREDGSS